MAEELQHELLQLDQKANKVGACSPCSTCHAAWQVWLGGDRCAQPSGQTSVNINRCLAHCGA